MCMDGYDDWKLNPPESKVFTQCHECEIDIHYGEDYVRMEDSTYLCADSNCFNSYATKVLRPITGTAELEDNYDD